MSCWRACSDIVALLVRVTWLVDMLTTSLTGLSPPPAIDTRTDLSTNSSLRLFRLGGECHLAHRVRLPAETTNIHRPVGEGGIRAESGSDSGFRSRMQPAPGDRDKVSSASALQLAAFCRRASCLVEKQWWQAYRASEPAQAENGFGR